MVFQHEGIAHLLHTRRHGTFEDVVFEGEDDGVSSERGADVAYVLFLEPRSRPDPSWSTGEKCLNWLVRTFQPAPALMHCELCLPPLPPREAMRSQFATYQGCTSSWMNDRRENERFYLGSGAPTWRAVPVFGIDAAQRIRDECDLEQGVAYSLARYITATPPFRVLARAMPAQRRAPAHCATLTARVLRNALTNSTAPSHVAAYYGPSTLYHELCAIAAHRTESMGLRADALDDETARGVETLLRAPMAESTGALGDAGCAQAVHALTLRACTDLVGGDATAQKVSQRQLAQGLLRWVVLRES
tara:strand:+ start:61 stop:972 length:912 start_codon:yes stop_codon:yes gene_type:complete